MYHWENVLHYEEKYKKSISYTTIAYYIVLYITLNFPFSIYLFKDATVPMPKFKIFK